MEASQTVATRPNHHFVVAAGDAGATRRVGRWYFGGLASIGATCCTHPLDLMKVHLQTQRKGGLGLIKLGVKVIQTDGIVGLYNGLSAAIIRQVTYSTTRFAVYETVKLRYLELPGAQPIGFHQRLVLGGVAGLLGGIIGNPADVIKIRMQDDVRLAPEKRRNYKHVVGGVYRVIREEGLLVLMNGVSTSCARATLMTIGQISCYDQIKVTMTKTTYFSDNILTHGFASFLAGGIATLLTMPLDVMKTRMMNAAPGVYTSLLHCAKDISRSGLGGFFKGFFPAFLRLGPHTAITFILLEQMRMKFGDDVPL